MTFSNILQNLRAEKQVSQQAVAEYIGVTKQAYSLYELGKRNPDNDMLYKISEYFDVSLDYLLGKSNIKNISSLGEGIKIPVIKSSTFSPKLIFGVSDFSLLFTPATAHTSL